MKSEPDEFSIDDLAAARKQTTPWFGVRNYQTRNFMRDPMTVTLVIALLMLGAVAGFLAGLLGLGGGMIMVPLLTLIFTQQGFPPEHVVHIAVATASATILFTSVASVREHQRHDAIVW